MHITVTIGRNIGKVPMSEGMWLDFKAEVARAMMGNGKALLCQPTMLYGFGSTQVGVWEGEQEQCAVFASYYSPEEERALIPQLQAVGKAYRQAAIGFVAVPDTESVLYMEEQR